MNHKIVVIAGPTASGKTEYAIEAAKRFDGEIVSADSMQVYRYMSIGSAKPTPEEMEQAKHHMVDEIDPKTEFSVAAYQRQAKACIRQIFDKGRLPVISGGTGLYINALLYDMDFAEKPGENSYRKKLEAEAAESGNETLYHRLQKLDPQAAQRIHPNNLKKLIRALEVVETTGRGMPDFRKAVNKTQDYDCILIGLNRDREELYQRIDLRVDLMMEAGLLEEIKALLAMGLSEADISMKGIGYKEIIGYLNGNYDLPEAVRLVKRNSRHYAKRQLTWFRRYEEMQWFNLSEFKNKADAVNALCSYISEKLQ